MRHLYRAGILAIALLFGIPGAALVLAHLGFIALPADAYVSPVSTVNTARSNYTQVLARLDTAASPRIVAARTAISAANELLPGHEAGVNRDWTFYRLTAPVSSRGAHLMARTPICQRCASGEQLLSVSARVVRLDAGEAEVSLRWTVTPAHRRVYSRLGEPIGHGPEEQRGELTIVIEASHGSWRDKQPD